MKKINIFLLLIVIFGSCSHKLYQGKTMQNKFVSNAQLLPVYDSLVQHRKDYKLIWQNHEEGLNYEKASSYTVDVMTLPNGKNVGFSTSNNLKVKEVMSQLPNITPVEFLLELRNIDGEIIIQSGVLPPDWIKREYFPILIELSGVDVEMPMISIPMGPPYGSAMTDTISLKRPIYRILHYTIGYKAIGMMWSFLQIGGGYPPSVYNNVDLMKEWYNSGKPREEFKNMLDEYVKATNK